MTLKPLIIREVKAFVKNPAFIMSIVLLFVFYGLLGRIISTGVQTAVEETLNVQVGVVVKDASEFVNKVLVIANQTSGGRLKLVGDVESGLSMYEIVVVIPPDFTYRAVNLNETLVLESYTKINTVSPVVSSAKSGVATMVSELIRKSVAYTIAVENDIDPSLIDKPVMVNSTIQFYGKTMKMEEYTAFSAITGIIPVIVAIIIGVNAMYASQFTATEKVEKAFEMLLAQPIPRRNVVFAKIIGSIVASMLMGIAYFAGILLMLSSATPPTPNTSESSVNLAEFLLQAVGFEALLISIGSIVLGLIFSGAIGVTLGSIVSDERIAGALTTPILFVFIGVGYALLFIGLPINVATGVIAGVTIAPLPVVAVVSTMMGDTATLAVSLLAALISTLSVMLIAVYVFNRDIVVLGLRIGRLKIRERT
uniref:ABC transporter permease n=1 Tax=Thermosphaera aggregans TaxID=54254 RepID=A0A7C2BJT2_9CREN